MPTKATTGKITKQGSHTSAKQKNVVKVPSAQKMEGKAAISYKKEKANLEDTSNESLSNSGAAAKGPLLQNIVFTNLSKSERLEKAIAAIDMKGSSSSHPVSVESCEEELGEAEEFESNSTKFMELSSKILGISFESEESASEDIDYVSQSTIYSEDDFFDQFQAIPEVDQMSLDDTQEEVKPQAIVTRVKHRIHYEDEGQFVNPLTGELSVSHVSEIPSVEVVAPVLVQASELLEAERASFESKDSVFSDTSAVAVKKSTLDALDDIKEETQGVDEDQEAYLEFLELEAKEKEEEQLTAEQFRQQAEELMKEQVKRFNFEQTMDFLNNLIDQVVAKAEYIDENVILRKNLDKRKIITQLSQTMDELSKQKSLMIFLNRQCSYHFRRKSEHQHIGDDYTRERREKFYQNLVIFGQILEKEKETQLKCNDRIQKYKEQCESAKQQTDEEIRNLEKLITSTFRCDKQHRNLKASINSELTKLSEFRETVSRVRLRLLLDQHNFTELSMRMRKLEDLGGGLNLTNYFNLAAETKALTKKIEERDVEIEKLKAKCNDNVHTQAHLKEKQRWMHQFVSVKDDVLVGFLDYKTDLRRYINTLRLKRKKLKQEIRELSFQCGLLDKPILLSDYDATVETANKLRHSNGELKKTVERLKKKITALEDMCAQRKSIAKEVENPFHV